MHNIGPSPNHLKRKLDNNGTTAPKAKECLPVDAVREFIVQRVRAHATCIILGETGSGKSTRIPQMLVSAGVSGSGLCAVTQPRRVAAVSLAQRVASEWPCECGGNVGYAVRFECAVTEDTQLVYMTDGLLLREAVHDQLLKRYSIVMLDEAHERSVHTDVLFALVKRAQTHRQHLIELGQKVSPLKVVIMSATMDVDVFRTYWDNAPVYYVQGRVHAVQIQYTVQTHSDYIHATVLTVLHVINTQHQILHGDLPGTVLVFLTGQEEIEGVARKLKELNHELPNDRTKMEVLCLYAAMNIKTQMKVFTPLKLTGKRRVVLSTNIAETSLTIPGVDVVIDCGKVKTRLYDASSRVDMLSVVSVSKAQACQRTGRAGRNGPGTCYRLYTEQHYNQLADVTVPDIQRCSLTGVVLDLLSIKGLNANLYEFDLITKPTTQALDTAVRQLQMLGAVERSTELNHSQPALTKHGLIMAAFPIDVKFSRMLLKASEMGCLSEMLKLVAVLSADSVFAHAPNNREESEAAHAKFRDDTGDHMSMLKVFTAYENCAEHNTDKWCRENYIQHRHIAYAHKVHAQLKTLCQKHALPINAVSAPNLIVRRALCHGLYMNSAVLSQSQGGPLCYQLPECRERARIHPSSVLHSSTPGTLVFSQLLLTNNLYMRDVTLVEESWLRDARVDVGHCHSRT